MSVWWLGLVCLIGGFLASALGPRNESETRWLHRMNTSNLLFVCATIWFAADYVVSHVNGGGS